MLAQAVRDAEGMLLPHSAIPSFPIAGAITRLPDNHYPRGNRNAVSVLNTLARERCGFVAFLAGNDIEPISDLTHFAARSAPPAIARCNYNVIIAQPFRDTRSLPCRL
jgi:hypothetical protein